MTARFPPHEPHPLTEFLGFRWEDNETLWLEVTPAVIGPQGRFLGAVAFAMIDYCMGSVLCEHLRPDEDTATTNISVNYIATVKRGRVVCRSQLDRRTRQNASLRSEIHDEDGRLLTTAVGTFAIFQKREKSG